MKRIRVKHTIVILFTTALLGLPNLASANWFDWGGWGGIFGNGNGGGWSYGGGGNSGGGSASGGGGAAAPIDGGLSLLIAAGVGAGIKKIASKKSEEDKEK